MDAVERLSGIIASSFNIVAFTGAGVSTESNIPDFRSATGLYNTKSDYPYPPEVMLSHTFFMEHPEDFYRFYREKMIYKDALPNDCHKALAKWEKMGKLKAVITQNIDGLHQLAGSENVLELHGSIYRNYCMKCGKSFDLDYVIDISKPIPICDRCGGIVRPDVVLYEEPLDQDVLQLAARYIQKADVLLVMGTSLIVYPAAGLVNLYKGDKLILINKTATPYDHMADLVIHDSVGSVMRRVL